MPRKSSVVEEDEGPSKAWLDSYADAMTLLLAFFVLLYAFSLLDETKFAEFKYGVSQAFSFASPAVPQGSGLLGNGMGINANLGDAAVIPPAASGSVTKTLQEIAADSVATATEVERLRGAISDSLTDTAAEGDFSVTTDARGVAVVLNEQLLFRSGSATINPEAPALGVMASVLAGLDNEVLVEGHTDSVPTNGVAWASNWELSSARATAVLRVLTEKYGLPDGRFSAVGHADTRPRESNDTAAGRSANRRTELVILVGPDNATDSSVPLVTDSSPVSTASSGTDAISNPVFNRP